MAIGGHMWPVYLGFKGGKAVATGFGVFLALSWPAAAIGVGVWAVSLALTRYIAVASCAAAVALPAAFWWAPSRWDADRRMVILAFCILLVLTVLWRHRSNFARIAKGEEDKVGRRNHGDTEARGS